MTKFKLCMNSVMLFKFFPIPPVKHNLKYKFTDFLENCSSQVKFVYKTLFWPFEAEASLNNISESSPYREENTALHSYKDQLVNAV
jgi:hypothetical protein